MTIDARDFGTFAPPKQALSGVQSQILGLVTQPDTYAAADESGPRDTGDGTVWNLRTAGPIFATRPS